MGSVVEALALIVQIFKAFMSFKEWIKDEKNKKSLADGIAAWQNLEKAKTHEERQNAAQDLAKLISG